MYIYIYIIQYIIRLPILVPLSGHALGSKEYRGVNPSIICFQVRGWAGHRSYVGKLFVHVIYDICMYMHI